MMHTTLNAILACGPCGQRPNKDGSLNGWLKLLSGLSKTEPDDEPLPFAEILRINGFDDALWAAQSAPQYAREWRLFAVWCARQVQHLITDQRSIDALNVAEKYALYQSTDAELAAAWDAARDAARDAALAAAWAAARAAARGAARAAAWDAARAAQAARFLEVVTERKEE